MASNVETRRFAVETTARQELKELKTESIRITRSEKEEAKEIVTDEFGEWTTTETPLNYFNEVDARSVLFRCIERERN